MEEQVQISFKLNSIGNESTTFNIQNEDIKIISHENIRFQFKVNVELNLHDETITVIPFVRYKCKETEILKSEAQFSFDVPGLKGNTSYDRETGEIQQKADIIPALVSASFSSMRGIIYSSTKDSVLSYYPLPLVEMDALLQKIGISVVE